MFFFLYQFIAQVEEIIDEETELLTGELKKKTQKNRNLVNQSPPLYCTHHNSEEENTSKRTARKIELQTSVKKKVIKTVEENNTKEKENKIANHAP